MFSVKLHCLHTIGSIVCILLEALSAYYWKLLEILSAYYLKHCHHTFDKIMCTLLEMLSAYCWKHCMYNIGKKYVHTIGQPV